MSPFVAVALALWERGYSVVPLEPGDKAIKLPGWQRYCKDRANRETLDMWLDWPDRNVGLALGPASGVIALDFDYDVGGRHAEILTIIGDSPVKKRGAKGHTGFYRFSNQRSVKYSVGGDSVLEVLSTGRQTVLPPSIHPDTKQPYAWLTRRTLLDCPPDELPEITAEDMTAVDRLFRGEQQQAAVMRPVKSFREMDAGDIAQALEHIPADDYHLWVRIGMALKDELGERGYTLWDAWSATSTKYTGPADTAKKWQSFKGSGVHIETLFWNALEMGYKPKPLPREVRDFVVTPGGTMDCHPIMSGAQKKTADPAPDHYIPGLVGMIARHILASSVYPLPPLALGAAIALAGAVMANKVQTDTGLYTNFYTLGVADSGGGKDHARRVCRAILARAGLLNMEIGIPKSGAGLLSGVRKAGAGGLMLLDEFGKYLKSIAGAKAASHETEITKIMMELYTSAGSVFSGMEYADHDGKMPRQQIVSPCLSMYPVTTPDRFYEAMTKGDALDGFIARFMVFECDAYPVEPVKPSTRAEDVPQPLLNIIQRWRMHPGQGGEGSMGDAATPAPVVIPCDGEAAALLDDYTLRMRYAWEQERRKGSGIHAIYARLAEQARKLAVIAHEGECVTEMEASWAIAVTDDCGARMARIVRQNVADNEQERNVKRLLNIVADLCDKSENGYAAHTDLVRRTTNIRRNDRRDIIEDLVSSGKIDKFESESDRPGPRPIFYKIL